MATTEPSAEKLTIAQHKARAALLCRWYGHNSHCYIKGVHGHDALDADTLLPVTPLDLGARRNNNYGKERTQR